MKKLIYVICLSFNDMIIGEMVFVNVPFNSFTLALKYAEKNGFARTDIRKIIKRESDKERISFFVFSPKTFYLNL